MNIKEIKEMISLMNENSLVEMEIEKDGMRIRLKKSTGAGENYNGPILIEREKSAASREMGLPTAMEKEAVKTIEIKAPMVGTFYRAPSPEAPPYVEVGQVIEPGQVVCVIEAMKLMNEIECDVDGLVKEIFIENGKPVEYGQKLFSIVPDA